MREYAEAFIILREKSFKGVFYFSKILNFAIFSPKISKKWNTWGRANFLGLRITTSATYFATRALDHAALCSVWNLLRLITRDVVNQGTHFTQWPISHIEGPTDKP